MRLKDKVAIITGGSRDRRWNRNPRIPDGFPIFHSGHPAWRNLKPDTHFPESGGSGLPRRGRIHHGCRRRSPRGDPPA